MKYIYYLFKSLFISVFMIFCYDYANYYHVEEKIVINMDTIKKTISHDLGITENLKKELAKEKISLIYDKPNGNIGDIFSFSVTMKYKVLLINQEKTLRIDVIVLLGY